MLALLVGKLRKSMMQSPCRPVMEIEIKPLILLSSLRHAVLCLTQSYFLWWAILQILTSSVDHYSEIGCCVTFCCLLSILTLMWWRPGTAVKYYSDPRELVYSDLSPGIYLLIKPANWLQWVLPYFVVVIHWHFLITLNHHFCFFLMKLRLPSSGLIFAKLCNLFFSWKYLVSLWLHPTTSSFSLSPFIHLSKYWICKNFSYWLSQWEVK